MIENDLTDQEVIDLIDQFSNKLKVFVNYDLSLSKIFFLNKIRRINVDIKEENFPQELSLNGQIFVITKLFMRKDAGENCLSIIERMKQEGYRSANIIELSSVCISEHQKQFYIYAYGSSFVGWNKILTYPFIHNDEIGLSTLSTYLSENDRFLGVKIKD